MAVAESHPGGGGEEYPSLPDFMRTASIENMWPNDIVYLEADSDSMLFIADEVGHLYLSKRACFVPTEVAEPSPDTYFAGVMRVLKAGPDDTVIDGYIADIRAVPAGTIKALDFLGLDEDERAQLKAVTVPVIGIVSRDEDGGVHYDCLARTLRDEAKYLKRHTDSFFPKIKVEVVEEPKSGKKRKSKEKHDHARKA